MKTVLIRADGSLKIGTGHIMRTLVLARALSDRGYRVIYLCRQLPGAPFKRIQGSGYGIETVANVFPFGMELVQIRSLVKRHRPEWVIVDHYEAKENYYLGLKEFGVKVMAVDDINRTRFPVDILLNQNINAPKLKYRCRPGTHKILGPKYALVKDVYARARKRADVRTALNRILVFMGGADPDNQTLKVLRAIVQTGKEYKVDIVLGSAYRYPKSIETAMKKHRLTWKVHRDVPDLSRLMLRADLAIGAGGSSSWEMCTLNLPMILMPIADNQLEIAKGLARAKAAVNLGKFNKVNETRIAKAIRDVSVKKLRELSKNAGQVCDGLGAGRTLQFFHS